MQEMIAHALGIVKIDFPMYKNLQKLEKFLAGDKGRFTKQILFLWRKSGLMSATLNFAINSKTPVTDGLLAWTEDHKKLQRLSGLGIIEERYLSLTARRSTNTKSAVSFPSKSYRRGSK
jgi:hypothetical protein